ncbi:hypothetical protein ACP179_23615 [Xenorhabdus stockiae]|uniref:hypothetical protein n=1 Tax=Xenorhabdus stockiae TaxID=351614 RepID=UPI003CE6F07B
MKPLTALERSKLQLNMMARLHDVFGDVKNEVEITPEFIRDTLAQFMQMAMGGNYHIIQSVQVGFGEVQQSNSGTFEQNLFYRGEVFDISLLKRALDPEISERHRNVPVPKDHIAPDNSDK